METNTRKYFTNVAGYDEIIKELETVISLFKDKKEFDKKGIKVVNGIVFEGRPGSGKTLLAREFAKATELPTYEFQPKTKDRSVEFQNLIDKICEENNGKAAVLLIDELDKMCEEDPSLERVLMATMDGFSKLKCDIVYVGTGNRFKLTSPLFRDGRFEKKIHIGLDNKYRGDVIKFFLKKYDIDESTIDLDYLNDIFAHATPASIKRVIEMAYIRTYGHVTTEAIEKEDEINDVGYDIDTVSFKENRSYECCVHEMAHCLMAYNYPQYYKVFKVIVDDGEFTSGRTISKSVSSKELNIEKYESDIKISLAGYCAGRLFYKRIPDGCESDLWRARSRTRYLINTAGKLGPDHVLRRMEEMVRNEADETVAINDKLASKLIRKYTHQVNKFLKQNKKVLFILADALYEKGIMYNKEITQILKDNNFKPANQK